jgi:uncharacterized protein (DUF433 family)
VAYPARLATALSGATKSQLRYWRQSRKGQPPLLVPEYGSRPALYSYADVVALRTFARMRERMPLQKVRKSVAYVLGQLPEGSHISAETIRALPGGKSAVWVKDDDYIDTLEQPGQAGFPEIMASVFRGFTTLRGREVPDLERPAAGLVIDPAVRGGTPVAEGTRITFDVLAALRQDGLSVADVQVLYPGVSKISVEGAVEFAHRVEELTQAA